VLNSQLLYNQTQSEEEDGSRAGRPRQFHPLRPSMVLTAVFLLYKAVLWRSAFIFTDEAHRRLHAPLTGKAADGDFLLRKKSIAVLFHSKEPERDKANAYFAEGYPDRDSGALTKIADLKVIFVDIDAALQKGAPEKPD